jgi:hypothetical protein
MGYLTTFTIYNDGCDEIPEHAVEFAGKIYDACIANRNVTSFGLGNHGNLVTCQKPRHASDNTFYAHAGNTLIEINYFSQETIDNMKRNPEFFKEILDDMAYQVKELKKEFKNYKEAQNK